MEYNILNQFEAVDQSYNQLDEHLMCLIRRRPYCRITQEQQAELLNNIRLELHTLEQELNNLNRMGQIMQTRYQQCHGQRSTMMFITHKRLVLKLKISYLNFKKSVVESLAN